MSKWVKLAVSLPETEFAELGGLRREEGIGRSHFFLQALRFWKKARGMEKLVGICQEGYERQPEDLNDAEAWEKVSVSIFFEDRL